MSDEHSEDKDTPPEGMVKKVRKVKGKRRSRKRKSSSQSIFEKGKEILMGMQEEEGEDYGHVDVAEQIRRLKKDKDEDKELDDIWGTKKRSSAWLWISLIGVILPLIGIGVGISILINRDARDQGADTGMIDLHTDNFSASEGKHGWFHPRSMEMVNRAVEILKKINDTTPVEDITQDIRPSTFRELNPLELDRWGAPVQIKSLRDISWSLESVTSGSKVQDFIVIRGRREDHGPFAAYFVYEGGKLLLDWDASLAWGEMDLSQVNAKKPRNGVLVRVLCEKKAIYDAELSGIQNSGYLLTEPGSGEFMFAYIPLDSEKNKSDDRALKTVLNYGRFIQPLKKHQAATLRIRWGNDEGTGERFEIVDFAHEGWVRP